jgi:hypothetical protein
VQLLAVGRIHGRQQERLRRDRDRRRREIDGVRGGEVEVDAEQRGRARTYGELRLIVELDVDVYGRERHPVGVDCDGSDSFAATLDSDIGIAVVDAQVRAAVHAERHGCRAQQFGEVVELREIDAHGGGKRLHFGAVLTVERERFNADDVSHEVTVCIGDSDHDAAAVVDAGAGRGGSQVRAGSAAATSAQKQSDT